MSGPTIRLSSKASALAHLKLAKREAEFADAAVGRAQDILLKAAIFYRRAAEHVASAQEAGMSQRAIAEHIEKSAAWVNRLLRWRECGYLEGTPFGPQSKASRERARVVQATEQRVSDGILKEELDGPTLLAQAKPPFDINARRRLVSTLGMLGSQHTGERANAAALADKARAMFGLTWETLIVPAKSRARLGGDVLEDDDLDKDLNTEHG